MIACQKKNLYKVRLNNQQSITGFNYFATAGESTLTAGESTLTAGVSTLTAGESTLTAGVSVFSPLLQAAKVTETIAKARITFFILCFV